MIAFGMGAGVSFGSGIATAFIALNSAMYFSKTDLSITVSLKLILNYNMQIFAE
jgi:hypothetical protein